MQKLNRMFRVWDFRVSHDQLLIRSAKSASSPKNLDVAFVGVEYMELPTKIRDMEIADATEADVGRAQQALTRPVNRDELHVLSSGGRRYVVVAAAMKVSENELDFMESSLEKF
jgi:hypothetical protein